MSNRENYPASLFPLRGDIAAEAGDTSVTVNGLQDIPIAPNSLTDGTVLTYVAANSDLEWVAPIVPPTIDLQTNGVDNGSQTKLNLVAGTNVMITDDGVGDITIDATGGGGGGGIYPPMTPPLNANFTWNNPNGYAVTNADKTARELISIPASSFGAAWMNNSALPSTPYTIDLGLMMVCPEAIDVASICLADMSGAIRAYGLRIDTAGAWSVVDQSWASVISPGTVNAVYTVPGTDGMRASDHPVFVRITDDGTHRTLYWSPNGTDYFQLVQQATGTGITPTNVGIIFYATSSGPSTVMAYHWLVSTSILPQNS